MHRGCQYLVLPRCAVLTATAELCYGPRQLVKVPESGVRVLVVCLHCAVRTEKTLDVALRMEHVLAAWLLFFFFAFGLQSERGSIFTDHRYFLSFSLDLHHIFPFEKLEK